MVSKTALLLLLFSSSILSLPSIKFTLPISQYYSDGIFENWNPETDLFLGKFRLVYTKPQKQSDPQPADLAANVSLEKFTDHRKNNYIGRIPSGESAVYSSLFNLKEEKLPARTTTDVSSSTNDPVQVGLELLSGMENTKLVFKQTVGTDIISWEFGYNDQIVQRIFSFLGNVNSRQFVVGNFKRQPKLLPSYNSRTGSLLFCLVDTATGGEANGKRKKGKETKVYIRCGPTEEIVSAREVLETFYEIFVETPRLCGNHFFRKNSKYSQVSEIQVARLVPDTQYNEALEEHLAGGNIFAVDSAASQFPLTSAADRYEFGNLEDLFSTLSRSIQGEVKKSSKLLDVVLNAFDATGVNTDAFGRKEEPAASENDKDNISNNGNANLSLKDSLKGAAEDYEKILEIVNKFIEKNKSKIEGDGEDSPQQTTFFLQVNNPDENENEQKEKEEEVKKKKSAKKDL